MRVAQRDEKRLGARRVAAVEQRVADSNGEVEVRRVRGRQAEPVPRGGFAAAQRVERDGGGLETVRAHRIDREERLGRREYLSRRGPVLVQCPHEARPNDRTTRIRVDAFSRRLDCAEAAPRAERVLATALVHELHARRDDGPREEHGGRIELRRRRVRERLPQPLVAEQHERP